MRPVDATDEELLVGTCKEFLPESEGRAGGVLGVAETPEAVGRLLAGGGGGARKVVGLVSPEDGAKHGMYVVVLTLLLLCYSRPCNSFSASIAN